MWCMMSEGAAVLHFIVFEQHCVHRSMCIWIILTLCLKGADYLKTKQQLYLKWVAVTLYLHIPKLMSQFFAEMLMILFHLSYCTNISFYLVLKAKRIPAHNHPVIERLLTYRNVSPHIKVTLNHSAVQKARKAAHTNILTVDSIFYWLLKKHNRGLVFISSFLCLLVAHQWT